MSTRIPLEFVIGTFQVIPAGNLLEILSGSLAGITPAMLLGFILELLVESTGKFNWDFFGNVWGSTVIVVMYEGFRLPVFA